MTLIDMKMPAQTGSLFNAIRGVVTFDILPDEVKQPIFYWLVPQMMDNDIPLTTKFEMEDFDTQFFFISLFSNIFFLGLYFLVQFYHYCFIKCTPQQRFKKRKEEYTEAL